MRFYDGIIFALLQQPLTRYGMAATYELVQMLATAFPATMTLSMTAFISSISAGLWRAFLTPLDVCKVRGMSLWLLRCACQGLNWLRWKKIEYKLNDLY